MHMRVNLPKQVEKIKMTLQQAALHHASFAPMLICYSHGQPVTVIACRPISDGEDFTAIQEMFTLIPVIDCDEVVFAIDAYFSVHSIPVDANMDEEISRAFAQDADKSIEGLNITYAGRGRSPVTEMYPYVKDEDGTIYWVNMRSPFFNATKENLPDLITQCFFEDIPFTVKTDDIIEELRSKGHRIETNFHYVGA